MAHSTRQPTVDDVTTTNTLEVWRDKLQREARCAADISPVKAPARQSLCSLSSRRRAQVKA
ncbi:hypothetical protein OAO87_04835 [bacterium]|nr:hypothetical protein [bacterium]